MTAPPQIRVERLPETDGRPLRLGRHIEHDQRSLAFAAPALPRSAIRSVSWPRAVDPFDQGADITVGGTVYHGLGSCVGNAAAGWLASGNTSRPGAATVHGQPVDETLAVTLYSAATGLDSVPGRFPTQDTGSSGIGGAKALVKFGFATGYRHAYSLQAALSAMQTGPVLIGVPWYESMFEPAPDGGVRVDRASPLAGGHELCLNRLDMDRRRAWFPQSWGDWGLDGWGWFGLDDLAALLADDGDVTIPTPITVGAPAARRGCLARLAGRLRHRPPTARPA